MPGVPRVRAAYGSHENRPKLEELKESVHRWLGKKCCKDLESLIGKLGHVAQVVGPGKMFLLSMPHIQCIHNGLTAHLSAYSPFSMPPGRWGPATVITWPQ